ncbi:cation-dependent mannose-6-phosphate receptor isoform 1-T2 [Pholidichthys leucotaenia]
MKLFHIRRIRFYLLWTVIVQIVLCGSEVYAADSTNRCDFPESEKNIFNRIEPLTNKNFSVKDTTSQEDYTYELQLCGDAGGHKGAGVVQVDKKNSKITVIGMRTAMQAIEGSDWVMLIYSNGEAYDTHCNQEKRRAIVMISCNRKIDVGNLELAGEQRNKTKNCFYLFELDSSAVCPAIDSRLSTGSILLIIFVSLLAVYLIGGFIYQRLVVGAKGKEQIANYGFWVEVGNLAADGCDFVCRSRNQEESPAYREVTAETLEEEPEDRDDHLLPM